MSGLTHKTRVSSSHFVGTQEVVRGGRDTRQFVLSVQQGPLYDFDILLCVSLLNSCRV